MRKSEHLVDPIFINRWSPRAFSSEKISKSVLMTAFEAARWAPSSGNGQPARFVYAENGDAHWNQFVGFMLEGNRVWAEKAAALVVVISKKDAEWQGKVIQSPTHSFDTGAAWMSFALQLEKLGWATHGMGGIEKDKIREALKLPENFAIECMIAVGKLGEKNQLPAALQEREMPNDRRALDKMVEHGTFKA